MIVSLRCIYSCSEGSADDGDAAWSSCRRGALERTGRLEVSLERRHLRRVACEAGVPRERPPDLRADEPCAEPTHEIDLVEVLHGRRRELGIFRSGARICTGATAERAGLVVRLLGGVRLAELRVLADQGLVGLDGLDLIRDDGREQGRHRQRREIAGHRRLLGRGRGRRTGIGRRGRGARGRGRGFLLGSHALDPEGVGRLLGQHGAGEQGEDEGQDDFETLHGEAPGCTAAPGRGYSG